jgi:hypothetical protein
MRQDPKPLGITHSNQQNRECRFAYHLNKAALLLGIESAKLNKNRVLFEEGKTNNEKERSKAYKEKIL